MSDTWVYFNIFQSLCPFPAEELQNEVKKYKKAKGFPHSLIAPPLPITPILLHHTTTHHQPIILSHYQTTSYQSPYSH